MKAVSRSASRSASVDPTGGDADQHDRLVAGAFEDLVGDPIDGPADVGRAEDPEDPGWTVTVELALGPDVRGLGRRRQPVWARTRATSFPASLDGFKGWLGRVPGPISDSNNVPAVH